MQTINTNDRNRSDDIKILVVMGNSDIGFGILMIQS